MLHLRGRRAADVGARFAERPAAASADAGAEPVLETGRHDPATGRSASETAGEWADGVAEELAGLVAGRG